MKQILPVVCFVAMLFSAVAARAQRVPAYVKCQSCGKIIGKEVPESQLSSDADFKRYGMFQTCQTCLDKKMNKNTQAFYIQVVRKYKWNSIAHNKALIFRPLPHQKL